jgi:GntR family transcriptional regulator
MDAIDTSKTHRLYLLLKEQIVSGSLTTGQRLPSEPDLAIAHQLSRVTVRRALDGLERDRLIRRQPGAGTFVLGVDPHKAVVADLSNMLAHLVAMGRATRVSLLEFGYAVPQASIAEALLMAPGERAQHSTRVRYLEDVPFSHLITHVPERIGITYTEEDLATTPLLALLERSGVVAGRAMQTISATLAGPQMAELLRVEIGSPLLSLTRVVFDNDGRGVEHLCALYRPDVHRFEMELTRTGRGADRRWSPIARAPIMSPPKVRA